MRSKQTFSILIISLFLLFAGCGEDDPVTPQEDHEEAIGMAIFRADTLVAAILRGVPTDTLRIPAGSVSEDYHVQFYDNDEKLFEAHDDGKTLTWEIDHPSILAVLQDSGDEGKFEFRFQGLQAGTTEIEFFILHQGHADFRTGKWPVRVR